MTLLQFLLMLVAGWLHRQQAAVIEYLNAENRLLRERLGRRRISFTDAERRNLAEKAKAVGRKTLRELGTIVTPETLFGHSRAADRNRPVMSGNSTNCYAAARS